ncbi:MAG TPA: replicative DNA helicase [Candidatus Saccharimonadales bacterium]|nr:replicative DNA helicase [Candidatus Saccharimonadales bacterium]
MAKAKVPPSNTDAEQSVLGAILIDKDAINVVSEVLSPPDFYNSQHGTIFEAMLSLYELRQPIDIVTLSSELKKKKEGDNIATSYITDLVNAVPTAANVEHYAHLIKEASTKRRLIQLSGEVAELCFDEEKELREVIDKAESGVFSISQGNVTRGFTPVKQALAASFDRIDELHKVGAGLRGVRTGFTDLDTMLSGLQPSNLLILAARPGTGKTAMAMNIAQHIGVVEKKPIGIFSLEMSQEELVDRLLVGQADVDAWRLKTGKLSETDFTKLSEAMGQLADAPIFIDDTPGITISEMRTKARRLQLEHGISLLIVDYLQLVNPGRKVESRVQEVSIVSQSLKNLARELKIPVVALSQLSRAVEHRGESRPQLADLRESGAIEQDADVVMFLYKPDMEATGPTIPVNMLIAKHRNGPTGEVNLLFRGDRIKFFDLEKQRETLSPASAVASL